MILHPDFLWVWGPPQTAYPAPWMVLSSLPFPVLFALYYQGKFQSVASLPIFMWSFISGQLGWAESRRRALGSGFSREKSKWRGTSYLEDRETLRHKLSRVVFGSHYIWVQGAGRTYRRNLRRQFWTREGDSSHSSVSILWWDVFRTFQHGPLLHHSHLSARQKAKIYFLLLFSRYQNTNALCSNNSFVNLLAGVWSLFSIEIIL